MKIMHIMRAPVGGLFRHVRDLAGEQAGMGHDVAIVCDSHTGGDAATAALEEIAGACRLGVHRIAMARLPGPGDVAAIRAIGEICQAIAPDIIHGHGAKGGLYARMTPRRDAARAVYTPHGGVLHYDWASARGALFLSAERMLRARADGFVFVCAFERRAFAAKIGLGGRANVVVHNGLRRDEFAPVGLADDAADVVFIGELRRLKGIDVLIEALVRLNRRRKVTATIVGSGPDEAELKSLASAAPGLGGRVRFTGALPARAGFALGRVMVVPSRAESFPYIVLEAMAAQKILIASAVGGIPEIAHEGDLVAPEDAEALAKAIENRLDEPDKWSRHAAKQAETLRQRASVAAMAGEICRFYGQILRQEMPETMPKTAV